jgi:hypothetical protein
MLISVLSPATTRCISDGTHLHNGACHLYTFSMNDVNNYM